MARSSLRSRRNFLKTAAAGASIVPYTFTSKSNAAPAKSDRFHFAAIGVGGRGSHLASQTQAFGDVVAICDVDRNHAERAKERFGGNVQIFGDYRKLLERKDIDAVTIGTPDHWHVPIAIAALRTGKDVYCEKPLTLTVQEGQELVRTVKETGRVLQVGSQQRSEFNGLFLKAVAIVHAGRLGRLRHVLVSNGAAPTGGPFVTRPVPDDLNWDMWLGQAPQVDYIPERCHGTFRWWFEYSGGMMTDWGAHHLDIANISIRLGRPIQWDPQAEKIIGDEQATVMLSRAPRQGYEWL